MIRLGTKYGKLNRLLDLQFVQQEAHVVGDYRHRYVADYERSKLRQTTGISDPDLLNRLYLAGFRSDNIFAITALPVAMAAWASGALSAEEKRAADLAVFEPDLIANASAIELFRSWLQSPPPNELWQLWEDFTLQRAKIMDQRRLRDSFRSILRICRKVAMASGGVWGLGRVSPAEQRVLARVHRIFELLC